MTGEVGLVGRETELSMFRSLLKTKHREPVVIVVRGEAGIGKTALLREFGSLARSAGICTLSASGARSESDLAFSTLAVLLDPIFSHPDSELVLENDALGVLATIWPSLQAGTSQQRPAILEICRAVTAAIETVKLPGTGVLVIVDDLHWADEASSTVISYLARHVQRPDLMIAVGTRPVPEAGSRNSLMEITRTADSVLVLGPLSAGDSQMLIGQVPAPMQSAILTLSEGNPFYLTQLAQHVSGFSAEAWTEDVIESVPVAVIDSILADIQALSGPARELAQVASVLGDIFDFATAGLLAGLEQEAARQAVDELSLIWLIVPVPDSILLSFRHPLTTKVIYDSLGIGRQRALHAAAAKLLSASGVDPMVVVGHIEKSADLGDLQAVEEISAAAKSIAGIAPLTAARLYRSAMQLLSVGGKHLGMRTYLLTRRVDCLMAAGKEQQAQQEIDAMYLEAKGDALAEVALLGAQSRVGIYTGTLDFERVRRGANAVESSDPFALAASATLDIIKIYAATVVGDLEQVRTLGTQLIDRVAAAGDLGLIRSVACVCAYAESRIGDPGVAVRYVDIVDTLIDRADDTELRLGLDVLIAAFHAEQWVGRWQDSLDHILQLQRLVDADSLQAQFTLEMAKQGAYLFLNDIPAAESANATARDYAQKVGNHTLLAVCTAAASELRMLTGDSEKADELAAAALTHMRLDSDEAAVGADPMTSAISSVVTAATRLRLGQPEISRELIPEFCGGSALPHLPKSFRARAFELLTIADVELGQVEQAFGWAQSARQVADEFDSPFQSVFAWRAAALAQLASGDLAAAKQSAAEGVRQAEKAGVQVEIGYCHLLCGRISLADGDEDAAIASFRDAVEVFGSVGARGYVSIALRELRALGRGSTRRLFGRTASGIESLSPRQAQIARLIAEGMTNQQIADQLFLSRRTVDGHVVRILNQLGVKSRNAVAGVIRAKEEAESGQPGDPGRPDDLL